MARSLNLVTPWRVLVGFQMTSTLDSRDFPAVTNHRSRTSSVEPIGDGFSTDVTVSFIRPKEKGRGGEAADVIRRHVTTTQNTGLLCSAILQIQILKVRAHLITWLAFPATFDVWPRGVGVESKFQRKTF